MTTTDKEMAILKAEDITDEFIDRCERYLTSLHYVLWGQAFDINDPNRRRVAAEWFAAEIIGLLVLSDEEAEA